MTSKTVTVEITFNVFKRGDKVKPSSSRSALPPGIYTVSKFYEPKVPYELDGTVFVASGLYPAIHSEENNHIESNQEGANG